MMALTSNDNYFEDFETGDEFEHARGKTIGEFENHWVTHTTMNTAEGHFNRHRMEDDDMAGIGGSRVVVGYLVFSTVVGLTAEDTSENALGDVAYDNIRLTAPTRHGDTLYARSTVIEKREAEDRGDAGIVRFRIVGTNQDDEKVCELEREVLLKKRSHWMETD